MEVLRLSPPTTTADGHAAVRTAQQRPHAPGWCRRCPSAMPCDTCAATQDAQPGSHMSAPIVCNVPCYLGHPTRRKLSVTAWSARSPQSRAPERSRGTVTGGRGLCLSYHAPGGDGLGRVALQVDGGIAACARGVGGGVGPLLDAAEHLIAQALHGLHLGRGAAVRPGHSGEGV